MADGKLVFPIEFDLMSAVEKASGDAERAVKRLGVMIASKPLKIGVEIDMPKGGWDKKLGSFGDGSIIAMREEMAKLVQQWNKLSEAQRITDQKTGEYTESAKKILARYSELVTASETYARSLEQIASAAKKAADAEIKSNQKAQAELDKRKAKAEELKNLLLSTDMSKDTLSAKLKFYTDQMNSAAPNSAKWAYNSQMVQQLREELDKLNLTQKKVTDNDVKQVQKRLQERARIKAALAQEENSIDRVNAKIKIWQNIMNRSKEGSSQFNHAAKEIERLGAVLDRIKGKRIDMTSIAAMPEKSIADITAKIQAYRNIMQSSDFGSRQFNQAMFAANQLATKLDEMNKKAADVEKWRVFQEALKSSANTIEGLNTLLSAWQNRMKGLDIGSPKWKEAAENVARYALELQRATQYAQDFQQKAFQGLSSPVLQREAEQLHLIRVEIQNCDEAFNRLRSAGLATDGKGNLTPQATKIIQDKAVYTKLLAEATLDADKALQKHEESERKAAEASKKHTEALKKMRDALNANEQRLVGLNEKLKVYRDLIQKQQIGSDAWNKSALEIRRLTDEIERANQRMRDFQQAAFRGLGDTMTQQQVEKLTTYRAELERIDAKIHEIQQLRVNTGNSTFDSARMNQLLSDRIAKTKQINEMIKSASDLQLAREKEINRVIEERKKKQNELKAKHQAELEALKQKRIANDKIRAILAGQENTIKNISQKLQIQKARLESTNLDGAKFEKIAKEVERLTEKLDKARKKMAELTGESTSGSSKRASNARKVNQEYSKQLGYLDRLVRRMALYTSVGMIGGFLTKVREVTAQFELQKVSLGAILQDQTKANQLFSEIKSFALKSPVSILDLTKYTKQLAAYKIGYEELFETTKKLTDVSVGLGVSMDRVVLAYGQVRATGHLRASEVRQFTEMGVPIVEELAAKLTKLNGEMVSAADVMDMISKRAISFQMVKEVFDDMTSAGGIFYNMQEKQGNTLYGLWAKLGDAASVMYDEIGRTGPVNSAMKGVIQSITDLMKNWRLAGGELAVLTLGFGAYKLTTTLAAKNTLTASKAADNYTRAQIRLRAATMAHKESARLSAIYTMKSARAYHMAAQSTKVWTAAKYKLVGAINSLKASLMGNWVTLLITSMATIGMAIAAAVEKATRLNRELSKIKEETGVLQSQSVRNFQRLVEEATKNADGSRKQKEALDELNRTYKEMVPEETLKIENLRKMKGNYDELTQAVREYIAVQQEEKAINTINEEEGAIQTSMQKRLRDTFLKQGLSNDEIDRFFRAFEKEALNKSKTVKEQVEAALEMAGVQGSEKLWKAISSKLKGSVSFGIPRWLDEDWYVESQTAIGELSKSIARHQELIESTQKSYADSTLELGAYASAMRDYNQAVQDNLNSGETMKQNQENVNMQVRYMASWIKDAFKDAGIAWKDEWANIITSVNPKDLNNLSSLNIEAIISAIDPNQYPELYQYLQRYKKMYEDLIPSSPVAKQIRAKFFDIANSTGASVDAMRRFLWDGKTALDDHIKTLGDQIESYKANIYKMNAAIAKGGVLGAFAQVIYGKQIAEQTKMLEALEKLMNFEKTYVKEKDKKGGRNSDPRLQNLKEEISLVQKLYQEYKQLEKQEGETKAVADMNRMAKDTIAMLSQKYGFGLPKTASDVVSALEILYGKMEQLPKKVFPNLVKELMEFRWNIENFDIDDSQKNIEEALKKLSERISRTKAAKEFYEKILADTGDIDLAAKVSLTIYGETGQELFERTVEQIREVFKSGKKGVDIDLSPAIDLKNERINYAELSKIFDKYQDAIIEKNRSSAEKIISEGQKTAASNISTWEKELAKAKDYEQQRTDIINRETQRRAEIYKSNIPQGEKDRLAAQSRTKQSEDLAKVNFEEFTKSEDYIKIFENLDRTSTAALKRLRGEMEKLIAANHDLSPENMKTLVKAMEDIDTQISGRGFGNDMVKSVKDYTTAIRDLKKARTELKASQAEYDSQLPYLDEEINKAKEEEIAAQQELNTLKASGLATENQIVAAELRLNAATAAVVNAEQKKANAANKVKKAEANVTNQQDKQKKASGKFFEDLQKTSQTASQLASVIGDIQELLGISEDSIAAMTFDSAIEGLQTFSETMNVIIGLQELYNIVTESNPWIAIAAAVLAVGSILGSWISNNKVRKANKEIERQQELLDQLEYTYSRLQKVADKLFGRDYVANYNQQLKTLQAEAAAYQKQAEAEKSKGKKTDKEKLKEYENSYRDTLDEIADMQSEFIDKFTGSSRADIARQMAQSWIDAKVSMSDTFEAIKGDYQDMIKSMLVEGMAARVIENALTPMWEAMEKKFKAGDINGAIDEAMKQMDTALNAANDGMEVLWKALEARGYDMKQMLGDSDTEYKGIAKSVAGASSEEINAVAAIGNTLMYYVQPIPQIGSDVAAIRQILQGGAVSAVGSGLSAVDYMPQLTAMTQYLANLPQMERHLSNIYGLLNRLVVIKGNMVGVNSFLRQ